MTQSKIAEALRELIRYVERNRNPFSPYPKALADARAFLDAKAEADTTVTWPVVDRYSGGASPDGIAGRLWVRLGDSQEAIEYVLAQAAAPAVQAEQPMGCPCDPKATDGARCPDPKTGRCLCDPLAASPTPPASQGGA